MSEGMKGFFEYAADDGRLPDGPYHLRATTVALGEWDDGRERLDVTTEVVSGEYAGQYGPRITWTIPQEFSGTTGDGREFTSSVESQKRKISNQVTAVVDGEEIVLSDHLTFDTTMLEEIGTQVEGREFFAIVKRDKNDYPKISRIRPLSDPPKGVDATAGGFSIDSL